MGVTPCSAPRASSARRFSAAVRGVVRTALGCVSDGMRGPFLLHHARPQVTPLCLRARPRPSPSQGVPPVRQRKLDLSPFSRPLFGYLGGGGGLVAGGGEELAEEGARANVPDADV